MMWNWLSLPAQAYAEARQTLNQRFAELARVLSEHARGVRRVAQFPPNEPTPTLGATDVYLTVNTSPTTLLSLRGGVAGQQVTIIFGDANTTVQHGAGFQLAGDTDRVGVLNGTLALVTRDGTTWLEIPR